jgi:hypothetical protein
LKDADAFGPKANGQKHCRYKRSVNACATAEQPSANKNPGLARRDRDPHRLLETLAIDQSQTQ